jgi:hypothetical protein
LNRRGSEVQVGAAFAALLGGWDEACGLACAFGAAATGAGAGVGAGLGGSGARRGGVYRFGRTCLGGFASRRRLGGRFANRRWFFFLLPARRHADDHQQQAERSRAAAGIERHLRFHEILGAVDLVEEGKVDGGVLRSGQRAAGQEQQESKKYH